jgi:hypothetical protein
MPWHSDQRVAKESANCALNMMSDLSQKFAMVEQQCSQKPGRLRLT